MQDKTLNHELWLDAVKDGTEKKQVYLALSRMEKDGVDMSYVYPGKTLIDIIQCIILRFCGCGSADMNLQYIRDGLRYIQWHTMQQATNEIKGIGPEWDAYCLMLDDERDRVFNSEEAFLFFAYWADMEELTIHGGSVYGSWLEPKGSTLLFLLNQALEDRADSEERIQGG